jgi:hypothetical protein
MGSYDCAKSGARNFRTHIILDTIMIILIIGVIIVTITTIVFPVCGVSARKKLLFHWGTVEKLNIHTPDHMISINLVNSIRTNHFLVVNTHFLYIWWWFLIDIPALLSPTIIVVILHLSAIFTTIRYIKSYPFYHHFQCKTTPMSMVVGSHNQSRCPLQLEVGLQTI